MESSTKTRGKGDYDLYTFEVVASKVESSTVLFELKTMSSFGAFAEPEVYELCSLEAVLKLYGGLELPDPTTVVFRSWRRMVIIQKEIPRIGFVCNESDELRVDLGHETGHTRYRGI